MKKYSFESFASDFLNMLNDVNDDYLIKKLNKEVKQDKEKINDLIKNIKEDNSFEILSDKEIFLKFLTSSKEDLIFYLEYYHKSSLNYYQFFEYEHICLGNGNSYLTAFQPNQLYLCGKYLDSINEKEKANFLYFLMCIRLITLKLDKNKTYSYLSYIEDKFDAFKNYLTNDNLALHPQITYLIGNYYLSKNNTKKAFEFFYIGANIKYEGNKPGAPFVEVSKNQYALGLMYFNNKDIKANYEKAKKYFLEASKSIGAETLPIIGDMYYEGLGVDKNIDEAMKSYMSFNLFLYNKNIDYINLNEIQKNRLIDYINKRINEDIPFDELFSYIVVFKYKIKDNLKSNEIFDKCLKIVFNTPINQRTENMDIIYNEYIINELRKNKNQNIEYGNIPTNLKKGDTFFFGRFNNEDIKWKVLDLNDDGSVFVITTDIIFKTSPYNVNNWLNDDFINLAFSDIQKKHIRKVDFKYFLLHNNIYLYLPSKEQLDRLEGKSEKETIKQSEFAKSISNNDGFLCKEGIIIKKDGSIENNFSFKKIIGIRPAMDVFPNIRKEKNNENNYRIF